MASCFFFSSRRRHTRWPRDWSSDVCSSDLDLVAVATRHGDGHEVLLRLSALGKSVELGCGFHSGHFIVARSEERRVGKECRFLWLGLDFKIRVCEGGMMVFG